MAVTMQDTQNLPTPEELAQWPDCKTPDCPNKTCRVMGSDLYSPCSAWRDGVTMQEWRSRIAWRREELGYGH